MLPPGLRSQQAGTILSTLMLIPPAMPPPGRQAHSQGWSALRWHVLGQASKQAGKTSIPLVPVMASVDRVKLELKMALGEPCGEFAVRRQQPFLFATSQKKVRRGFRFRSSDQDKRIVVATRLASGRPKN